MFQISRAVKNLLPFVATDTTRNALACVCFRNNTATATDGHILIVADHPTDEAETLIPAKMLRDMFSVQPRFGKRVPAAKRGKMKTVVEYYPITAERTGDTVTLKCEHITMSHNILNYRYPNAEGVNEIFPKCEPKQRYAFNPALVGRINNLALAAGSPGIDFEFREPLQGAVYQFTGKEHETYRGIIMPMRLRED